MNGPRKHRVDPKSHSKNHVDDPMSIVRALEETELCQERNNGQVNPINVIVDDPASLSQVVHSKNPSLPHLSIQSTCPESSCKTSTKKSIGKAAPSLTTNSTTLEHDEHHPSSIRFASRWAPSDTEPTNRNTFKRSLSFFAASTRSYDPNVLRHTLEEMKEGGKYRYVLHPLSTIKSIWDFTTALFVLLYCWIVPIQMCFEFYDVYTATDNFMHVLDVWFILDMVLRFRTGIVECGVVVMNPKIITKLYMKSVWFYIDLFSSLPFEIFFEPGNNNSTSSTTRHTIKLVKYLKIPKLLRLGRLLKNLRQYKGYTGIITIMVSLFFLVHAAGCVWVVLINPCDENTILFEPLCSMDRFNDLYILSFQIALSTILGVSSTHLESKINILSGAYKTGEIAFSLYIWAAIMQPLGAIYMALIFGNVITMVHSFNRIGNAFRKKMDQVYYEMDSLNLPKTIRTRILAYYDYLWVNNRNLSEKMTLLNDPGMSEPLRHQIAIYLYKDQLLKIPFFQHASDDVLGMICMMLRQIVYMPNDYVFKEGEIGRELYMIVKGCVEVLPPEQEQFGLMKSDMNSIHEEAILLADGDFFGEIGIVMEVFRTRSVRTKTMAELCILTRDGFNSILGDFPEFANEMKKLVVKRISLLYGKRDLPPETLDKITSIAEKNMQRRIKAYGEVVNHRRRKPMSMYLGRRGDKFNLEKRLDISRESSSTQLESSHIGESEEEDCDDENDSDDEIDDKLLSTKVWKMARQIKRLKADSIKQNQEINTNIAELLQAMHGMQAQMISITQKKNNELKLNNS